MTQAIEERGETRHSDLYRWLKLHYPTFSVSFARHRPSWILIADEIAAAGIVGIHGQRPSPNSVRQIWERVCRDIAESERARLTGTMGRKTTTRATPGWQPPVAGRASTTSSQSTKPASPFAPTAGSSQDDNSDPYSPERLTAGLREVIAKRSGR